MNSYTIKEASEKLDISIRVLQKRCKYHNFRKKDNQYYITDENIDVLRTVLRTPNERTNATNEQVFAKTSQTNSATNTKQLELELEALKSENESLKAEINIPDNYEGITHLDNGKTLLVFNAENSNLLDEKLIEWQEQKIEIQQHKKEIEKKDESFNKELASKDEIIDHYKNQFEYQREQSTKILDIHQKLVDTINIQAKSIQERNLIEAVEKDIIDKNTHKPKKPL